MPPAFNFLTSTAENALGSVETAPILRVLRPATFALWFCLTTAQAVSIVATGEMVNWMVALVSTLAFVGVHLQFWYEESEQGRKFHHTFERVRGRIYEDELTGMPNSRHFVFELRRQMMRSVRNGRAFSVVLADLPGLTTREAEKALPTVARALRQATADGDFIARLEGSVFAAVVADDSDRSAADKASHYLQTLATVIPGERAGSIRPVVSLTGYQGELEVRDFLRRAQRDLVGARSRGTPAVQGAAPRPRLQAV
jgi:GGDEF domain-containing protein